MVPAHWHTVTGQLVMTVTMLATSNNCGSHSDRPNYREAMKTKVTAIIGVGLVTKNDGGEYNGRSRNGYNK